jgi:hypothetical protein
MHLIVVALPDGVNHHGVIAERVDDPVLPRVDAVSVVSLPLKAVVRQRVLREVEDAAYDLRVLLWRAVIEEPVCVAREDQAARRHTHRFSISSSLHRMDSVVSSDVRYPLWRSCAARSSQYRSSSAWNRSKST